MEHLKKIIGVILLIIASLIGLFALFSAGTDVGRLCGLLVVLCVWIIVLLSEIASNTKKSKSLLDI